MRNPRRYLASSNGGQGEYHHSLSVHYASTPALNSSNSVESNSVNSDDLEVSSSSAASTTHHHQNNNNSTSDYHSSSASSSYATSVSPGPNTPALLRLASVSSSRLYHPASVTVNGTLGRPRSQHFADYRVVEPPPSAGAPQPAALATSSSGMQ